MPPEGDSLSIRQPCHVILRKKIEGPEAERQVAQEDDDADGAQAPSIQETVSQTLILSETGDAALFFCRFPGDISKVLAASEPRNLAFL